MENDATSFFDDAQQDAARWLAAWDGQGIHRTATAGDAAGAEWLAREATALGAAVAIEEFALDRLDPVAAFLEIGGERIKAVPVFDAPASDAAGIASRLGLAGGDAEIVFAELSPRSGRFGSGESERLRRGGGHRGFVILCTGENPGLGLLDAEGFRRPYGAAAVHVSNEAHDVVLAAAAPPGCCTAPISARPAARCRSSRRRTICLAAAELSQAAQPHRMAPKDLVPGGETRDIHRAGGHCLALNGTNRWFHLPQDRWPDAVDLAAVTRTATAAARIALALARG